MANSATPKFEESMLKRSLWYAAAAGAVVGLTAGDAEAQIVYTDIPDETVSDHPGWSAAGFDLDFDGDADPELYFSEDPGGRSYTIFATETTAGTDVFDAFIGTLIPFGAGLYGYPFALSAGALIGPATTQLITGYSLGTVTYASSDPNGFVGAGDVYIGVRLLLDGSTHWGWIRVEMTANGAITIRDYAYEAGVNTAIEAGNMGVAIEPGPDGAPGTHNLSSVYPNPFNPQAQFSLEIAEQQDVSIAVFDALGREVASLHEGTLGAGTVHRFQIDGSNLPSGVYIVRAIGEHFTDVRQVTLSK